LAIYRRTYYASLFGKGLRSRPAETVSALLLLIHTWSPAPISSSARLTCTPAAISGDCWSNAKRTLHVLKSKPFVSFEPRLQIAQYRLKYGIGLYRVLLNMKRERKIKEKSAAMLHTHRKMSVSNVYNMICITLLF